MALKVELKPGERIILGTSVITNDNQRTRLFIEGNSPILRQKDILTPAQADTPAKNVYLVVQMMYLENDVTKFQDAYFEMVNEIVAAAPSTLKIIDAMSDFILRGDLYKALKQCGKLTAYEEELLGNAKLSCASV